MQTPTKAAALAHYSAMAAALDPKPGCYFAEVDLHGAKIVVECRDEEDEDRHGNPVFCTVIEGALINGHMVRYCDELADLFVKWAEEVEADTADNLRESALDRQIEAYQERTGVTA